MIKKIIFSITAVLLFTSAFAQKGDKKLDRSVRPAAAPAPGIKLGDIQSFELPNGLKVFVVENHKQATVAYSIALDIKPSLENDAAGTADITSELMTSGTKNKTKDQLDNDIDFIVDQLDWDGNVDPNFTDSHYCEPIVDAQGEGWVDKWVCYGTIKGTQYFSAKELTVAPGAKCVIKDKGASGVIAVQGRGRIGKLARETPSMIRFGEMTEDEVFISASAAAAGVEVENLGKECPLVLLRYFGPDVTPQAPDVGDHKKK